MNSEKEIFVLGAGASACFGLPMWNELAELILEKLGSKKNEEDFDQFTKDYYSKAAEWIKKVGPKKEYETIDLCIFEEAKKLNDKKYQFILDLIFRLIGEIFSEKIINNDLSLKKHISYILIKHLANNYIINPANIREFLNKKTFIDFNYDNVLSNALTESINYETDPAYSYNNIVEAAMKGISIDSDNAKMQIKETIKNTKNIYKPHGCFDHKMNFLKNSKTYKGSLVDKSIENSCISCYFSNKNYLCFRDISVDLTKNKGFGYGDYYFRKSSIIYILGVGPISLEYNLDKIDFPMEFPPRKVVYTCFEDKDNSVYRDYFAKKFGSEDIVEYKKITKCEDLKDVYEYEEQEKNS